jgi:uncharacterized membrane protein
MRAGCLSVAAAVLLAIILPWIFADLLASALVKLQLGQTAAGLLVVGIFAGSLINIPVRRIARSEPLTLDALAVFGLHGWWPAARRTRRETVVAVNVGGCVIPVVLAVYEVLRLAPIGGALGAVAGAVAANIVVCYMFARPVAGVGIVMPTFVPALVACGAAYVLAPQVATPVAFTAGVAGPLIGADLLHLRDIEAIGSGMVSIGGAGTFDGILLSGILALYLA